MITFLIENLATILISAVILGVVALIVINLRKNKKNGKAVGCGCGCESCPSSSVCHK